MRKIVWTIILVASVFCFLSVWLTTDRTVMTVKVLGSSFMVSLSLVELLMGGSVDEGRKETR